MNQTMRLKVGQPMLEQPDLKSLNSVVTPILVNKRKVPTRGGAPAAVDEISLATPSRVNYRVSFIDEDS